MSEPTIDSMATIPTFECELGNLINRYSKENGSDTPDFLLADYLVRCLETWNLTVRQREKWYGRDPKPLIFHTSPYPQINEHTRI